MQKLSDISPKRITIIHRNGKSVSRPPAPKKGMVFSLFNFSRTQTSGKNTPTVLTEPVPEMLHPDTPRADLAAIKNWVASEEKIVHDHEKQKTIQPKSVVPLSKSPRPDILRTGLIAVRNWVSFWEQAAQNSKEPKKAQAKSVVPSPQTSHSDVPRVNLTGVTNWVALEEKIVHNYKQQKTPQSKGALPLPTTPRSDFLRAGLTAVRNWVSPGESVVRNYRGKRTAQPKGAVPLQRTSEKQPLRAFETFSTQTAAFSSSLVPKPRNPVLGVEKIFLKREKYLLVLGWLTAGALMLLYVQGTFSNHEVSQKLSQLKNEKNLLEQSYVVLKNTLDDQRAEMQWLNSELQDTTSELKKARSEVNVLRTKGQTQSAIVKALKAQSQAFEKIIDQGGMSALSGAAAGFSDGQFSTSRAPVFGGEVAEVNERQGFIVVNVSAAQGAYPGRWITISRNGRGLAVGRIDRVYSTMSVAVLRNPGMLRAIQEGDSVLFS